MNQLRLLFSMLLIATCLYLPAKAQDLMLNPRFENQCFNPSAPCNRVDGMGNAVFSQCTPAKYRISIPSDFDPFLYPCSSCRFNVTSTHGLPKFVPNPYSLTNALVNMECISNPTAPATAAARVPRGQGIFMSYDVNPNHAINYVGSYACIRVALGAWKFQANTGTVLEIWSVTGKTRAQQLFEDGSSDRELPCSDWNSVINPDATHGFRIGTITEADLGALQGYAANGNPAFEKQFSFKIPDYQAGPGAAQTIWIKMLSTQPNGIVIPSYVQIQEVNMNILCTAAEIASFPVSPFAGGARLPDRCFCGVRPNTGSTVELPVRPPFGLRMANPNAGETSADQTSLTGDIKVGIDPQTRKLSLQNAPSDLNIEEAKLYDLNGRTVLVSQGPIVSMKQIDLSGIASGFYILTLKTSQGLVRTPISF